MFVNKFLADTTLNDRRFWSFRLDATKNEVESMSDIREPRSDKSCYHYLCVEVNSHSMEKKQLIFVEFGRVQNLLKIK